MRRAFLVLSFAFSLALAGTPALAEQVGVAAAVNQQAEGTPPGGTVRTLSIGDRVVHDERIDTDGAGLLQVLLADGTTFTVGPNSQLTIDSFVYDPNRGTAKITASLGKGVFRFIGGRASKSADGVRLNTPIGTVGIRGGIVDFFFEQGNQIPPHINLVFGRLVQLFHMSGEAPRLYTNGYSIYIGKDGKPYIRRTPKDWLTLFRSLIGGKSGKHGGASNLPTNSTIQQSNLPQSNSNVPPSFSNFPLPFPGPGETILQQGNQDHSRGLIPESSSSCPSCCPDCS
jgi:hypothetical protein